MIDINEYRKRKNRAKIDDDDEWFFEQIKELYADDGTMLYALNPEKVENFKKCCETVSDIISGSKIKMDCDIRRSCPDEGHIRIIGRSISVSDPTLWCKVAKTAKCVEIYPRTDGNIQVDLTFYGLTFDRN